MSGVPHSFRPTTIQLPQFEVSWAGEIPGTPGFCFGSDDGRLWFTGISGPITGAQPIPVASSGAAVTGVAFWDNFIAVSTPNEIVLRYYDHERKTAKEVVIEAGAHGILATPSGRFFAPSGISGLLQIKPESEAPVQPRAHVVTGRLLNFYTAILLHSRDQGEVLACATRRDGLTVVSVPHTDSGGKVRLIPCDIDVVDACALAHPDWPLAAAALGIDGSVFLMKDILADAGPLFLKFEGMQGNAYRILSAEGNLFVLTSKFLYSLPGLVGRFLREDTMHGGATSVRAVPMEAVDAHLAYARWLLIVMPGYVLSVDIHTLLGQSSAFPLGDGRGSEMLAEPLIEDIPITTQRAPTYEELEMTSDFVGVKP
jgi:hypothetical protein